jgi:hypothetical protein
VFVLSFCRCLEDLVPPATRQARVERQRMKIFFTLRMHAELFHPMDRFEAEKIGALVVKGPVLAIQACGDRARRSYGDLDLLVRQRDSRRATEIDDCRWLPVRRASVRHRRGQNSRQ